MRIRLFQNKTTVFRITFNNKKTHKNSSTQQQVRRSAFITGSLYFGLPTISSPSETYIFSPSRNMQLLLLKCLFSFVLDYVALVLLFCFPFNIYLSHLPLFTLFLFPNFILFSPYGIVSYLFPPGVILQYLGRCFIGEKTSGFVNLRKN
jgi:hypothetical protein